MFYAELIFIFFVFLGVGAVESQNDASLLSPGGILDHLRAGSASNVTSVSAHAVRHGSSSAAGASSVVTAGNTSTTNAAARRDVRCFLVFLFVVVICRTTTDFDRGRDPAS